MHVKIINNRPSELEGLLVSPIDADVVIRIIYVIICHYYNMFNWLYFN
jgi:hypothetical protein